MDALREKSIRLIIDTAIKSFADGFELRHNWEVDDPNGTINSKKIIVLYQFLEMNLFSIVHLFIHLILLLAIY